YHESCDNSVRRPVDHTYISRSFVADVNEIVWRFGAHYDCACDKDAKNKSGIHARCVHLNAVPIKPPTILNVECSALSVERLP
ncbi:MAG: hypothetical protein DME99_02115, partial [Verrucomicrobia bacterium]